MWPHIPITYFFSKCPPETCQKSLKLIDCYSVLSFKEQSTCAGSKELKNGIEILLGQVVLKLRIKTVKMLFGSKTQEPLVLPKF